MATLSPYVPSVCLWCSPFNGPSGLWQSHISGRMGLWGRKADCGPGAGTWGSQLLLVAVEGLDQRPWSLGLISWPAVARPLATVLCAPARSGIGLQQPTVHSVLPEASGSHQPLCSQVPLLAKRRQLLAC